jgi:hypothetical protein
MRGVICKKHLRYKGASKPNHNCVECWVIYLREVFIKLNDVIENSDVTKKGGI